MVGLLSEKGEGYAEVPKGTVPAGPSVRAVSHVWVWVRGERARGRVCTCYVSCQLLFAESMCGTFAVRGRRETNVSCVLSTRL